MTKKIATPVNPLIYRTAAEMAATFYEAGRSSGMTSKYKSAKHYAAAYMERFIPLAVQTLLKMLKKDSGYNEHVKAEIHAALTDPINDPALMEGKMNGLPDINANWIAEAQRKFEKNIIDLSTAIKPEVKTVIHK